jgi:hypothetical protein
MADYTPVFVPGNEVTFTATADVIGGQLVALTGQMTVGPAPALSTRIVGVAAFNAAAGSRVTVFIGQLIHETVASGTIAANTDIVSAAGGLMQARGAATVRHGFSLTSAVNGGLVRWMETVLTVPASAPVPATGATAGTPGTFTPGGSATPANLAALSTVTASPTTAWTTGQRVVLGDASSAYWNGTTWVAGTAA